MISIQIIIGILILHLIGDFLLQAREIANNKSKKFSLLLEHGSIYTLVLIAGIEFGSLFIDNLVIFPLLVWWALVNGIMHTFIDYFTSKLNTKLWVNGKIYWFFTSIGCDQTLHFITLFLTYLLICS